MFFASTQANLVGELIIVNRGLQVEQVEVSPLVLPLSICMGTLYPLTTCSCDCNTPLIFNLVKC